MSRFTVFISYSRLDGEWVNQFTRSLQDRGIDPWLDILSLSASEPLIEQIEKALRGSEAIVAVLPSHGPLNPYTLFEIGVALGMSKPFIPIASADADSPRLPSDLARFQSIVRGTPEATAEVVAHAITRQLTAAEQPA